MLEEGADQSFGARFRLRIAIIARRDDDGRQRLLCNRRATICLIRLGAGQVFRGFVQLRNFAYSCTAQHCSQLIEQQIAIARVGLLGRHLSGRHLDRRRDFQCNEKRGAGGLLWRAVFQDSAWTYLKSQHRLDFHMSFTNFRPRTAASKQAFTLAFTAAAAPRRRVPSGISHARAPLGYTCAALQVLLELAS